MVQNIQGRKVKRVKDKLRSDKSFILTNRQHVVQQLEILLIITNKSEQRFSRRSHIRELMGKNLRNTVLQASYSPDRQFSILRFTLLKFLLRNHHFDSIDVKKETSLRFLRGFQENTLKRA